MTEQVPGVPARSRRVRRGRPTSPANSSGNRRASGGAWLGVVGIAGEVLITAGVLVFVFLGWQLWLNDLVVGAHQDTAGATLAHSWKTTPPVTSPPSSAAPPSSASSSAAPSSAASSPAATAAPGSAAAGSTPTIGVPAVAVAPKNAVAFAVMYVPRFGTTYSRSVSQGVGTVDVLDKNGIGHYPGTQMPGQIGNFAVAAHRTTYGAPFKLLATLQVGDKIYIQTPDGYYTYSFRGLEYVRPTGVGVLDAMPQQPGVAPTDRVLTMTSCNPMFSASERIIAYSVLESWQPASAGAPQAVQQATEG